MKSLETLAREWEEAGGFGTKEERMARAERWAPYYAMLCQQAAKRPFDPEGDPSGFIRILTENRIVGPTDTLLDIGAGMGDYGLRLAKHCRWVTELEMNPAGVELMERRAAAAEIENVSTVQAFWERYEPEQPFDVTFASMFPAICSVAEIRRMEAITRRTCCILTVLPGSYDMHRRAMMQELNLRPKGMVTDGERYEQVLTAMGRTVQVITRKTEAKYDVPVESILQQYPVYFNIFGVSEGEATAFLNDYLARHADNGVLHDESHLHFALLTWPVG